MGADGGSSLTSAAPFIVLPLMMLDESIPETYMAPIHPDTGEVWDEKRWELVELATAWRYESDDDLRKEAEADYMTAQEGITFEERPLFKQSSFLMGAAYKDLPPPREMYHCHPKTWETVPDEAKAKFEVRVHKEYSFLGQNDERVHPYQRGRALPTGLKRELREIIETGRLVGVVTTRLVLHSFVWGVQSEAPKIPDVVCQKSRDHNSR